MRTSQDLNLMDRHQQDTQPSTDLPTAQLMQEPELSPQMKVEEALDELLHRSLSCILSELVLSEDALTPRIGERCCGAC